MSVMAFCFVFQYDILLGDLITEFSTLKSSQVQFSESSKLHLNERRARPLDTSSTLQCLNLQRRLDPIRRTLCCLQIWLNAQDVSWTWCEALFTSSQ